MLIRKNEHKTCLSSKVAFLVMSNDSRVLISISIDIDRRSFKGQGHTAAEPIKMLIVTKVNY